MNCCKLGSVFALPPNETSFSSSNFNMGMGLKTSDRGQNSDGSSRLLTLSLRRGYEGILADMIRREISLLSSLSSSSSSSSPTTSVVEYLKSQFSHVSALLPFVNIVVDDSDTLIINEQSENVDIHAAYGSMNCASKDCNHSLICRMISSLVGPIVDVIRSGKGGVGGEGISDEIGEEVFHRLNLNPCESSADVGGRDEGSSDDRNKDCTKKRGKLKDRRNQSRSNRLHLGGNESDVSEFRKLHYSRLDKDGVTESGEEVKPGDPFGFGSSCGGSKASQSNHNGTSMSTFDPQNKLPLPFTEMTYQEKVRLFIDDDVSSGPSSSSSIINILDPSETNKILSSSTAEDCVISVAQTKALVAPSSMPSLHDESLSCSERTDHIPGQPPAEELPRDRSRNGGCNVSCSGRKDGKPRQITTLKTSFDGAIKLVERVVTPRTEKQANLSLCQMDFSAKQNLSTGNVYPPSKVLFKFTPSKQEAVNLKNNRPRNSTDSTFVRTAIHSPSRESSLHMSEGTTALAGSSDSRAAALPMLRSLMVDGNMASAPFLDLDQNLDCH